MAALARRLAASAPGPVAGVGVGLPGSVNPPLGVVNYANNLPVRDTPLARQLSDAAGLPVVIENDANCAALGEYVAGAAKGSRNSITVTLGTGIGGGIITEGRVYGGTFFAAGEIGHHVIAVGGERCSCGRLGCFEAYCSATGLIRVTRRAIEANPKGLMSEMVGGDLSLVNAKLPFDASRAGDKTAALVIERYEDYLAEGLTNLIHIFDPDVIVIGGGIGKQGENLLVPVRERVSRLVYGELLNTRIVPAALGNDAGIVGAGMLETRN
jgi:glucokinase